MTTDQPADEGGGDAGLTPVELFIGSLAACVGYFVGQWCARHQVSAEGLRVVAEWTLAERPHRVGSVTLLVALPAVLSPEQRERVLRVAEGCTVHHSLTVAPEVHIDLTDAPR